MSFMTGVGARSLARSELLKSKAATSARLITERPCVQIAAGISFSDVIIIQLENGLFSYLIDLLKYCSRGCVIVPI